MLASPLPPPFRDTYNLSTSSLGCNALCIVISFLVLWSILLNYSLVHFKKSPEYLTRGTAQVFISLTRFLQHSFVSNCFFSSPEIFFLNFFFRLHLFDSLCLQDFQVFVGFLFSERSNLTWFGLLITWVRYRLPLFFTNTFFYTKFHSYVMTVYSNCVY